MSLPPWVVLGLREPLTDAALVAHARSLGVPADLTRDGVSLPGGFLCRVVPEPFPERLCDLSLWRGPLELGRGQLHISGGTNELERSQHMQPESVRLAARELVERAHGSTPPGTGIESAASRKVGRLLETVVRLAPLSTAVVLPSANHTAIAMGDFGERAQPYLLEGGYPFPMFAFLKVRDDADLPTLESVGMWIFGLPDVAMAMPQGVETQLAAHCLGEVQREMVAEGRWFETGERFVTESLGEVALSRRWSGLWVSPLRFGATAIEVKAAGRFARRRALGQMLGPHTLHHAPASADGVAVEHFLCAGGTGLAISNGLSDDAQRGATPEDESEYVEIALSSPHVGPWASGWVRWIVGSIRGGDGTHPIRPRDRMVLGDPSVPVAGVILWPMGHLEPELPGAPRASLWDMIPFMHEELATFRASPGAQGEWMDARLDAGDIPALQSRWSRVAG